MNQTGQHFSTLIVPSKKEQLLVPQQHHSYRQIRPSRFLNEVDLQFPTMTLASDDNNDNFMTSSIRQVKSLAVSPVQRTTTTEQDIDDRKLVHQQTFRKQKREKKVFFRNHASQQELPRVYDYSEVSGNLCSPITKTQTTESTPKEILTRSPILKAAQLLVNDDNIKQQKQFEESQRKIQQLLHFQSGPQIPINQETETKINPHHKKAVSFRKSILVFNMNSGQISKDELSESSKPLKHIMKTSSKEKNTQNTQIPQQYDKYAFRRIQFLQSYEEQN